MLLEAAAAAVGGVMKDNISPSGRYHKFNFIYLIYFIYLIV